MAIHLTLDDMKKRGYVPPPPKPESTEEELQRRYVEEVTGWFTRARGCGQSGINLWFPPYSKLFEEMAKPVLVHGHNVGILEYEGHLYRTQSGSGDCELNLHYIGAKEANA